MVRGYERSPTTFCIAQYEYIYSCTLSRNSTRSLSQQPKDAISLVGARLIAASIEEALPTIINVLRDFSDFVQDS